MIGRQSVMLFRSGQSAFDVNLQHQPCARFHRNVCVYSVSNNQIQIVLFLITVSELYFYLLIPLTTAAKFLCQIY